MSRIVYRIVVTNPPTDADYMTYEQLGKALDRDDPESVRMRSGYSVYLQFNHARDRGRRFSWKSNCFVAEYVLSDDDDYELEQTSRNPKHYTLWCDESLLRGRERRITPVSKGGEHV